jgi:hypothetical protein
MERDARFAAMLSAVHQRTEEARQAEKRAEAEKLLAFKASGDAPFFDDVLREMKALTGLKDDEGQPLSIKDLYERACWANPEVRAFLLRKAVADAEMAAMRMLAEALKSKPKKRKR